MELLHDILEELADKLGIYGACKQEGNASCEPCTCRVGFMVSMRNRIECAINVERIMTDAMFNKSVIQESES